MNIFSWLKKGQPIVDMKTGRTGHVTQESDVANPVVTVRFKGVRSHSNVGKDRIAPIDEKTFERSHQ